MPGSFLPLLIPSPLRIQLVRLLALIRTTLPVRRRALFNPLERLLDYADVGAERAFQFVHACFVLLQVVDVVVAQVVPSGGCENEVEAGERGEEGEEAGGGHAE